MKKEKAKYEFKTIEQICNVINEENFERLISDLALFFSYYIKVMKDVKEKHPELSGMKNSEITECSFVWIDDGNNEINSVTIEEKETGKITEIKFPKAK